MTRSAVPSRACSVSLLALGIFGCLGSRDRAVEIPFVATIDNAAFSCSADEAGFAPSDLRLYVHDLALVDESGRATPIDLTDDGIWQNHGVALLDFENGADHCADGTTGTHTTLTGRIRAGTYHALQFVVGVPFERNHADAATADAPLNLGRMHWGWQGGYKFLRFEGRAEHSAVRFHLGSTGCEGIIGNITRCSRPNRATIRLDGFTPDRNAVQLDLTTLIPRAAHHEAEQPKVISCMAERDDASCAAPFAALGLDLASGAPGGAQTLFKVIPLGPVGS